MWRERRRKGHDAVWRQETQQRAARSSNTVTYDVRHNVEMTQQHYCCHLPLTLRRSMMARRMS